MDCAKLYLYLYVDVLQARIKELEEELDFERSARNKVTDSPLFITFYIIHNYLSSTVCLFPSGCWRLRFICYR